MATFSPSDGVNETEPTLISDGALQNTVGAEYRVGEAGLFVARGRDLQGTVAGTTTQGLYEAGFDASAGYVLAHVGNSLHASPIGTSLTFSVIGHLAAGSSAIVGAHYANRHYLAFGSTACRVESVAGGGVTAFNIGMAAATFAVGLSVSATAGLITATTGLEYWVTEYDSRRGIESLHGSTANTGAISLKASVIATVTGVSVNPRADILRWYRSVDGGGYPDGGLIRETAIGTTQITDTRTDVATLTVPQYGIISIGGLDTDRDEAPPAMSVIFGPFQDSLLGVATAEPRVLRFTPAGYPDSWPSAYGIPLETERRDEIVTGVVLPGRIGVFCNDSVHVIYRLPRDADSIFAAGEAQEMLTGARGCVSRRGAVTFTPPGSAAMAAWVSRDGIWAGNLTSSPVPLTDKLDWEGRVSVANLASCRLVDDVTNRRLVFLHRRVADTTYSTGLWYLDYQEFAQRGMRVTFANHGPLADGVTIAANDGVRRVVSIDSRSANGQVYLESTQDVDDSQLINSAGAVHFLMKTKEFLPAGAGLAVHVGKARWMHGAGPATVQHRFYFNRRDDNPETKRLPDSDSRNASDVMLGRNVNAMSLELESTGTVSYGVHWIDIEGLDAGRLGGSKGA